jgi:hypothetical protein
MKTTATPQVQAARKMRMSRLSGQIATKYNPRQHRRAARIAAKWSTALFGDRSQADMWRTLLQDSYHYTHRRFARIQARKAATI